MERRISSLMLGLLWAASLWAQPNKAAVMIAKLKVGNIDTMAGLTAVVAQKSERTQDGMPAGTMVTGYWKDGILHKIHVEAMNGLTVRMSRFYYAANSLIHVHEQEGYCFMKKDGSGLDTENMKTAQEDAYYLQAGKLIFWKPSIGEGEWISQGRKADLQKHLESLSRRYRALCEAHPPAESAPPTE